VARQSFYAGYLFATRYDSILLNKLRIGHSRLSQNVRGNERADTAATSAVSLPITNMKLPARELIPCVSKFCLDKWQDIWDCCKGNKLHSIYPMVGIVKHSRSISRYDSILLNRLRIGHSRLTHSYY